MARYTLLLLVQLITGYSAQLVTLDHGGQLQGRSIEVNGTVVDQFVGIRYAKPPVGSLRFKKPEALEPWTGVVEATRAGGICLQYDTVNSVVYGEEDCLFLDITVPGGVGNSSNKPVMVWIHGGGYYIGTGPVYIGAPLALQGDVIVVAINYRLGIVGFLADETDGTGNYGLWDQKAAIMWVKENIASFGGDPDSITIFGESAGGGSVVAQMLHVDNDNLFQRAIAQSGTLYERWGWYRSKASRCQLAADLKEKAKCSESQTVFECLQDTPANDLLMLSVEYLATLTFGPVPDNDFFPPSANDDKYDLTGRFDVMAGYTENELALFGTTLFAGVAAALNESLNDGLSLAAARSYLTTYCEKYYTKSATEECVQFFVDLYGLQPLDARERLIKAIDFAKHSEFDTDIVHLLTQHSSSDKATYGYQLSKFVQLPTERQFAPLPEWMEEKAGHAADLFYVFGYDRVTDEMKEPSKEVFDTLVNDTMLQLPFTFPTEAATEDDAAFSKRVQTLWTNFAKTGNPNNPVNVGGDADWPEFGTEKRLFNLNDTMATIPVPDLPIHERIISTFYPIRRQRILDDKADCAKTLSQLGTAIAPALWMCVASFVLSLF